MAKPNRSFLTAPVLAIVIAGGSLLAGNLLESNFHSLNRSLTETTALTSVKETGKSPVTKTSTKEGIAPEAFTGFKNREEVTSEEFMMVAAHPAASWAGAKILEEGGSALDAVMAAQMVLNLVEPQSSGIGGGGFLIYWDEDKKEVTAYDGRETAPLGVDPKFFFHADGKPKKFMEAVIGGASVGVPGLIRMFDLARKDRIDTGQVALPLEDIFEPAIDLAAEGFPVSPRLHKLLSNDKYFTKGMAAYNYFYGDNDKLPEIGEKLKNPKLAESLESIAENGLSSFYTGQLAEDIVDAVHSAPGTPGSMTIEDMANYEAKKRPLTCHDYREDYRICGMPPPSSGGVTVGQIMGILEATNIDDLEPGSADAIQLFAEAMKLSFADRGQYLADSDFVNVPAKAMLDKDYLQIRASQMDMSKGAKTKATAGHPSDDHVELFQPDNSIELPSTTHIVAVDSKGNAASITTSIETAFGSHQMVGGFLLNNQLTDFAKSAYKDGQPIANRIEPGKRPRSSMAPTIVIDKEENELKLLTGSPGGSRIIGYVAQSLVAMLDWDMSPQEAANMPRFLHRNWKLELEENMHPSALIEEMKARGYDVAMKEMTSGVHIIEQVDDDEYLSGVDPRREGQAYGEENLPDDIDDSFTSLFK